MPVNVKNQHGGENIEYDSMVQELQYSLIEKLKNASINKNRKWAHLLNVTLIEQFEVNINVGGEVSTAKCRLKCPVCAVECLCNLDSYWKTSNVLKHLNSHEIDQTLDLDNDKENLSDIEESNQKDNNEHGDSSSDFIDVNLKKTIQLQIVSLKSSDEEELVKTKIETERKRKLRVNAIKKYRCRN